MSLKLHTSLTEAYGFISRFDSAITLGPEPELGQPPPRLEGETAEAYRVRFDAWSAPYTEWERPLNLARATGNYTPITAPDVRPLWFRLRQIPMSMWAKIDRYTDGGMSDRERACLFFRVAVVGLDGDVPPMAHDKSMGPAVDKAYPDLGPIRTEAFVDLFTGHEAVVIEVATHVYERRKAPGN